MSLLFKIAIDIRFVYYEMLFLSCFPISSILAYKNTNKPRHALVHKCRVRLDRVINKQFSIQV